MPSPRPFLRICCLNAEFAFSQFDSTFHLAGSEMSGVWSSIWRFTGICSQASSSRATGFSNIQNTLWTTPGFKVQCLKRYQPLCTRLNLLTLLTKPSSRLNNLHGVLAHHYSQGTRSRYAHSLSGAHCRHPKSRYPAKAKRRKSRTKQFDFPDSEIQLIFQGALSRKEGNQLLQILHKQRVSGTLDEKVDALPRDVFVALEWLRIKIPVDEDQAIIARLEKEEQEDDAKAEKIRIYRPQWDAHKTGLYGPSRFDELRKINRQKAAERAAQMEKAMMEDPGTKEIEGLNTTGKALSTRKRPEWLLHYREAATIQGKMLPSTSKFERLWPSALITFAVVGLSIVFAINYIPPSRRVRLWPDIPPAAATLIALIGINTAVLIAWRITFFWKFMNHNFILTAAYPFARCIIGATFSHQTVQHFLTNMVLLWLVGTRCLCAHPHILLIFLMICLVHDDVGRGVFLGILFSCGATGMFASLTHSVLRNNLATSTLGASGGIVGIIATGCMLHSE